VRKRYAYRLAVVYPDGVDWLHPPDAWVDTWKDEWGPDGGPSFSWPVARVYFSRSGAKKRADLLESYGCTVTIERSNEVTWPTDQQGPPT